MDSNSKDLNFMQRAIQLAKLGGVDTFPNPMVGAVIVHNNKIIGEGFHEKCGENHAEINAIKSVKDKSLLAESTIYVTLEPCAHFGKTPPCANRLVTEKFKRVVVACKDPFSKVAGKGFEIIKNANIDLTIGICENEAIELNKRFFTFHQLRRPYVILKWAQTKDGFIDIARISKEEQKINWISSPSTKALTHSWRSQEAAILVGWKTINNDNPSLTTRNYFGKNPLRIILDPNNKMDANSTVLNDEFDVLIFNKNSDRISNNKKWIKLIDFNVENVLNVLYSLNILSIIIEGGSTTHQQFIQEDLWDEARIITGDSTFESGIKAAKIDRFSSTDSFTFSSDSISIIKC